MPLNTLADALSGLQANQQYMNVVGDNIANVNTVGYKTQSIHFNDLLNQTLSYGGAPAGGLEGVDPLQVGMGVGNGSINLINTQGTVQDTGRLTDMAIQGGGYFMLTDGRLNHYTRDGSFTVAPDGTLESPVTGMSVLGWSSLNANGTVNNASPLGAIKIPLNSQTAAATTAVGLAGNLDASQAVYAAGPPPTGGQFTTTLNVYDSQGFAHQLSLTFQKTSNNNWSYAITGGADTNNFSSNGTATFDAQGKLTAPLPSPSLSLTYANGTANGTIAVDFSQISQLSETSQVNVTTADGSSGGTLSTFSVGKDGVITAVYSNGSSKAVGQIALADFRNPDGLLREGHNLYAAGINSGAPQVGPAGVGNLGSINTGQLEGSNVDLAAQFAQMIQAQQGFNANTKVVTTTNNMLQSVISIIP